MVDFKSQHFVSLQFFVPCVEVSYHPQVPHPEKPYRTALLPQQEPQDLIVDPKSRNFVSFHLFV